MRGEEGYLAIVCQRLLSWEEARPNAAEAAKAGVELRFTVGAQTLQDASMVEAELAEAAEEVFQAGETRKEE